jgi:exopolyphosphatase/guanosine-5'-triphosphate,3'-diphosphate pyrophosphatase
VRLGVVDIGSNSARLQIVDGTAGGPPLPMFALKSDVHLAETVEPDGTIGRRGVDRIVEALAGFVAAAEQQCVDELIVFATAAVRDAPNAAAVNDRLREAAGIELSVLAGEDEARLTFLAVRRWLGWSAATLLLLDIGGGSLEIAQGKGERPELSISLPLGAGRLTRTHLKKDPPRHRDVKRLRSHAKGVLSEMAERLRWEGPASEVVVTSKTFKTLACLGGAPPGREGPFVRRTVERERLRELIPELESRTVKERARLPGVSANRAPQILAGAVVAEAAMTVFDIHHARLSPWALREGILLRRLDSLADPGELYDLGLIQSAAHPLRPRSAPPVNQTLAG